MRNYKLLLVFVLVFALVLPAFAQDATPEAAMGQDMMTACAAPTGLPASINLGAIFALSGAASVYGLSQQQAVNLAVQQINDAHYLGDSTTLAVQFEDSAGDAKQAINAMTKMFAEELKGTDVLVNSVDPGWVQTHSPEATRTVEEGVRTTVWLATLPAGGPSGQFFRDRTPVPW